MHAPSSDPVRLVREYLDADYRATVDGRAVLLRIGAPAPSWLRDVGLVFLTAWNPRSTPRPDAENRVALAALREALAQHAPVHDGVGADVQDTWQEPSLLAIGLPLDVADREARRHEQNAIVVARPGDAARLRIYRPVWR